MMQLSSPRERLPHIAPSPRNSSSSRQPSHRHEQLLHEQQQGPQSRLQLLDLAFEGHVSPQTHDGVGALSDSTALPHNAPLSARNTARSVVYSSRDGGREYGGDPLVLTSARALEHYDAHYESMQNSHDTMVADESALMEASDPELFQAGVEEHARRLGIDPTSESDFLWIARESLVAPLPNGWYHATASESGAPYYYNEHTGESRWDHPCDDQFRRIFHQLKQKAGFQNQQNKRYDHYTMSQDQLHTASYYATESNYQTLAWQDEQQHGNGVEGYTDDAMYTSYAQHDWSATATDAQDRSTAAEQSGEYYADYSYTNGYTPQLSSDYEVESEPSALVSTRRTGKTARSGSSSPRNNLVEAQNTDRLTQQYLSQLQSMEELKAKDAREICDLRIQIQTLSKQSELQEERVQGLTGEKAKLDEKLSDYKEKLDSFVQRCENLAEMNQTLKRELLTTRNRVEEQQQQLEEAAKTTQNGDDSMDKVTAQLGTERALREELERKCADATKAQSRLNKELEDSQSAIAKLRDELSTAREVAEKQNVERANADATDAIANAAIVSTLEKRLRGAEDELQAAKMLSQKLQYEIEDLKHDHEKATAVAQATHSQQLAERDAALESHKQELETLQKRLQRSVDEKETLDKQLEEQKSLSLAQLGEAEDQQRALKRENRAMERDFKNLQTLSKGRDEELAAMKRMIETLETKLAGQDKLVENARATGFAEAERASAEVIRQAQAEKARVAELYAQELQARRKLHNRLMELQGNIRVFCRVRPIQPVELKSDQAAPAIFFRDNDHESLELIVGGPEGTAGHADGSKGNYIGQKHAFEFDHIFQPSSTQAQVFEQTRALVVSALDGFNVCIFAYGQTGSGKTHTMEGSESDRGVNFRALQELFAIRDDRKATGGFECTMKLSILEVYNETIVDLLESSSNSGQPPGTPATKGLDVRMGKNGVYVDNLIEVEVFNENDVIDLMKLGHSHRSVGAHDFNEHSSRSHLVLSIQIETIQKVENRRRVSKLHLIDLAGSERVSKTAASGQRLKEAQNINRSLSALGDVIAALGANSKHVPYRNSKLTFLLQDSLSGNSKVLMFVNVSPVQWNAWETLCSLNFASRCRNVALGQAPKQQNTGGSSNTTTHVANSAPSPTLGNGMHATASMSSMAANGGAPTRATGGNSPMPPRGAPPSTSGNGMHATASMSSMPHTGAMNGASTRAGGTVPPPPRGAPPSVSKASQRVTYG